MCLFMEEGSLCLIGAAYPVSRTPLDRGQIPRELLEILKNSLSIVFKAIAWGGQFYYLSLAVVCTLSDHQVHLCVTWARNYNASLKFRKTYVKY